MDLAGLHTLPVIPPRYGPRGINTILPMPYNITRGPTDQPSASSHGIRAPLAHVEVRGSLTHLPRAAETPFNLILEARPMSDLFRSGIPQDFDFFEGFDLPELLRATAWRTSALKADSSTASPSRISIARRTFPSRLELNRRAGSFRDAPLAKVSFTTFL